MLNNAAEAVAARDLTGEPSGQQTHDDPSEPTIQREDYDARLLLYGDRCEARHRFDFPISYPAKDIAETLIH